MKASAIVCAVLAGTFGLSTIASAQGWRGEHHDRGDRGDRAPQTQAWDGSRGFYAPPEEQRETARRLEQQREGNRYFEDDHRWDRGRYAYANPGYRHYWNRGAYLPREYLSQPYYVGNWNAYPGLYAPPYGYQWVNVDGQFLLVALATGLIANALINSY